MNIKLTWLYSITLCGLLASAPLTAQQPARSPMPDPTEAEMMKMQKDIDDMLASMSPKERAEFEEEMQKAFEQVRAGLSDEGRDLFDKLESGDISDEEIDKLLNELVPPAPEKAPEPAKPQPQTTPSPTPAPKPIEPKQIITSKHQQALDRINAIIMHTQSFMVKAGALPELPGKIKRWEEKKAIIWRPGLTWNNFKNEIEKFLSLLNRLIERDAKTKEYIHLDELLKHESLYNNLSKLEKTLSDLEPKIEEASPLTKKLSKSSKAALQKTINQYIEALYTLQIPANIAQLFEKFEPKAKKSRETEEEAAKKAAEASKAPRVPGKPVVAGKADNGYDRGYNDISGDHYGYAPAYEPAPYYAPASSNGSYTAPSTSSPKAGGAPSAPGSSRKADGKPAAEPESEKGETGKDEGKEEQGGKADKDAKPKEDPEVVKLMQRINVSIDNVATAISTTKKLSDLKAFVTSPDPVDVEIATRVLPDIKDELVSLRKGVLGNINALQLKVKAPEVRKHYKSKLEKIMRDNEKTLNAFAHQIDTLQKEWGTLQAQVPGDKQYAYFSIQQEVPKLTEDQRKQMDAQAERIEQFVNQQALSDEEKSIKKTEMIVQSLSTISGIPLDQLQEQLKKQVLLEKQIPAPASLFDIYKALQDIKKAINNL